MNRAIGLVVWAIAFALPSYAQHERLFLQPQAFPTYAGIGPFVADTAFVMPPGSWYLQTQTMWFNAFRYESRFEAPVRQFVVDVEGFSWAQRYRYGWIPGVEVRFELQGWHLFPGTMDGFLDGFHKLFHFPNQDREKVPWNRYRIFVSQDDQTIVDDDRPHSGITQWSVGLKIGESNKTSASVWVKGPVSAPDSWFLASTWNVGMALTVSDGFVWQEFWGRPRIFGGLTQGLALQQNEARFRSIGEFQPILATGGLHFGATFSDWTIAALASAYSSPWTSTSYFLGKGSGEIHIGIIGPLASHWNFEFALVEEFLTYGTMEVGFHLSINWSS